MTIFMKDTGQTKEAGQGVICTTSRSCIEIDSSADSYCMILQCANVENHLEPKNRYVETKAPGDSN